MSPLTPSYWNERWETGNTPWDIGGIAPAIRNYLNQLQDPEMPILIPGAGRGYEAQYLFEKGFSNVWVCDWAPKAKEAFLYVHPHLPEAQFVVADFFSLNRQFGLILEQTFFCALLPAQRPAYVQKVHDLLQPGGKVAGLLFAEPFPFDGPPFGGTKTEYLPLFEAHLKVLQMDITEASIRPRAQRELFFEAEKPL